MPKQGLTKETQDEILRLKRSGYSMNKVARALKLTKGQVAGVLHRTRKAALERGLVDEKATATKADSAC